MNRIKAPEFRVFSLRPVQGLWLLVAVSASAAFFAGPASQWSKLTKVCHPDSACQQYQLDPTAVATLKAHGISLTQFAAGDVALLALVWVLWYGLAALIIRRKPEDLGAVLASFFLVSLPTWSLVAWLPASDFVSLIGGLYIFGLLLFGFVFPDGHFKPRWTRWLVIPLIILFVVTTLPLPTALTGPAIIGFLALFLLVIVAQVQRFRSGSSWIQRQQTKWTGFGLVMALLGVLAIWFGSAFANFPTGYGSLYEAFTNIAGMAIVLSAIPVSIAIAVLRSGLWDIDRVINRALVYSTLVATLASIYVGSVLGLQALFRLLIGTSSAFAIVISTLAITALFGPLRQRLKTAIDRRFYRSKYDAEKTLAAFVDRLRDEVELDHLSGALTSAVRETLQPEHVSLWLRG